MYRPCVHANLYMRIVYKYKLNKPIIATNFPGGNAIYHKTYSYKVTTQIIIIYSKSSTQNYILSSRKSLIHLGNRNESRHCNFSRIILLIIYRFHTNGEKRAVFKHTKRKGTSLHTQHNRGGSKKLYTHQIYRNAYTRIYNRLTIQLICCKLTVIRYLTPSRSQKQSYALRRLNIILKFNRNILKISYSLNVNKRRGHNSRLQSSVSLKHIICRTRIRYYRTLNV